MQINFLYQDYSMKDREKMLSNLSSKKENSSYSRSLTQEEIDREKDQYASKAIQLEDEIESAQNAAKLAKTTIDALKKIMQEKISKIRTGKEDAVGTLYGLANHPDGKMMFYDKYGELIKTRDLTPDERQGRLFIDNDPALSTAGDVTIPVTDHDALTPEIKETVEGAASVVTEDISFEDQDEEEQEPLSTDGENWTLQDGLGDDDSPL